MKYLKLLFLGLATIALFQTIIVAQTVVTQQASRSNPSENRSRGVRMLKEIKGILKEIYYDKNYHGIDIEKRFDEAMEQVKSLDHNWQIYRVIAQLLLEFDDSHTQFFPPGRANRVNYGFSMQMVGAKAFIVDVKKGGDAAAKGLAPGDEVVRIGRIDVTRESLWKINYLIYALDPQEQLSVFVRDTSGEVVERRVIATFKSIKEREAEARERRKKKREDPFKCHSANTEIALCRLETFSVEKKYIDRMMAEASKHKKLILDLRGNGGGYVKMTEYLTGHFFDRDIKIADFVSRKKTEESRAKAQKGKHFGGELIVLIDSRSASASEVFARLMQLEKRGKVIGDVSAGAVMTSIQPSMAEVRGVPGFERFTVFGMNVTVADLIMSDGKRLEKVGVIPDIAVGPSPKAIAEQTDPVLAYAVRSLGGDMDEKQAGALRFLIPKDEDDEEDEAEEAN